METLADNGNSNYAYVDDLDEAQKLFVEDLTSTLQVIALDPKIQVNFNTRDLAASFEQADPRYQLAMSGPIRRTATPQPPGGWNFGLAVG